MKNYSLERANSGTPESHSDYFLNFSEVGHHFIQEVYIFEENNKDLEWTCYVDILENEQKVIALALNAQCVMKFVIDAVCAE